MNFQYRHGSRTFGGEILRVGPAIQVVAFEGEFYAALVIGWMQSGRSAAVITKWEIDGPAECQQLVGTNGEWSRYWEAFLSVMPDGLAEAVQAYEETFRQ
ncbi:MAG: hypothetical protein U0790_27260 [Isosphaeraceae bacterium]